MSFENLSFIGFPFIAFLAVLFLIYYIVPKGGRWLVLLAASLAFYASYGWQKAGFILAATLVAWLGGLWMRRIYRRQAKYSEDARTAAKKARRKARWVLDLCVVLLLAMLLYGKLGKETLERLYGSLTGKRIDLPFWVALGVSYYTFSLIGYLADVYWRKDAPEGNYFRLLLFSAYFPKVLQGPISRRRSLAPQLREGHDFDYRGFTFGIQRICWGYFKKMVIADRLALLVNYVFGMESPAGAHVLVAVVFSAFQLYCDFSGCMDIALGVSEALGIRLEENFNHPFFSRSAAEFWRRWHISLGTWFKDYVYMPLAISPRLMKLAKGVKGRFGPRASRALMTLIPTYIVWILTGLWHATGWNYFAWGLFWGTLISQSAVFDPEIKKLARLLRINTAAGSWKVFQMVRTFLIFCVSRLLTAPGSLEASAGLAKILFTRFDAWQLVDGSLYTVGLDRPNFLLALACLALLGFVSHREESDVRMRERIAQSNTVFRWAIYYALFFSIILFGVYGPGYDANSFVYMKY